MLDVPAAHGGGFRSASVYSAARRAMALSRPSARRILPAALILFVGAAFIVLTVTGTRGVAFTGLLLGSSLLLVLLVGHLAFAGEHGPGGQTALEDFGRALVASQPRVAAAQEAMDSVQDEAPPAMEWKNPGITPVKAFVQGIVPIPQPPPGPPTAASRRVYLEALRQEGKRLIGLARVTGLNVEPYRAYLLDARKAAVHGNMEASLTSIRLANELLRGSVENAFLKHQKAARDEGRVGGP